MAGNKPTAVHFSLIFFVMATIVAGVMAYMYYDDGRELRTQMDAATREKDLQKTAALKYSEQISALKAKLGHNFENVGNEDPTQAGSVLYAMNEDLKKVNPTTPPADYKTALEQLVTNVNTAQANYTNEQALKTSHENDLKTLRDSYQKQVDDAKKEAADAKQRELAVANERDDALASKDAEIQQKNTEILRLNNDLASVQRAKDDALKAKDGEIKKLEESIDNLTERIRDITKTSFERPDGLIVSVDNSARLVWINLGSADNLPKRLNFSVYRKNHRGVGRASDSLAKGPEDLKGAIEVTRILGDHLAEARILDENFAEPISIDDPIYTPIWGPNQEMSFAFVGLIDMDNDGRSDRDLLHDVLRAANAKLQIEIDDDGTRTGGPIDEHTKFLVVGEIPSIDDLTDDKEKAAAIEIQKAHAALKKEARYQGVITVTLNDFMAFIGYVPRQRVFRPGDNQPYTLRSGQRATEVSAGQTSPLYSRTKRLTPPKSSGQTSGAYSGNK